MPSDEVRIAGLLTSLLVNAATGALMVAGAIVIWRARSTRAVLAAVAFLTIPALILIVMGPAFVFILRNMTT